MNDDLISRAELKTGYISIDDVMSVFDDFMCGEVDEDGTDTFLEMLRDKAEQYPQEPKTGHWIEFEQPINYYATSTRWKCNICDGRVGYRSNYCPNCGAKMVEPQESEEV